MVKVRVGMGVRGDVDCGFVVAMSRNWCIYQPPHGDEVAEPWQSITVLTDGPAETISSVKEVEVAT